MCTLTCYPSSTGEKKKKKKNEGDREKQTLISSQERNTIRYLAQFAENLT